MVEITVTGENVLAGELSLEPSDFASVKGTLIAHLAAVGAEWPALETVVDEGADVVLNVATEDKVVRIGVGAEPGDRCTSGKGPAFLATSAHLWKSERVGQKRIHLFGPASRSM